MTDLLNGVASTLRIAREGSFRGAMRSTGLGFRTLQNHIKKLEEELGFVIFHRTRDGIVFTTEGKYLLDEANNIEEILKRISRLGKSMSNDTKGEIMLATTEGLGIYWISPLLESFNKQNPNIAIRLHASMALTDMRRFEVDVALQVVEPILPDIKRVKIGRLHLILAASQAYLSKHGEPKNLDDLKRHTFVFHTSPQFSDRHMIQEVVGTKLSQAQFIEMRNSSAHYVTIERGMGIGFLPSYIFGVGSSIVPLALPVRHALDIWLCFHEKGRSTPRIATVIDWLSAIFDPRLYPWFRREFVAPKDFDKITSVTGVKEVLANLHIRG